ncbi:uncharacterized protein LOC143916533 [Arctopsyche grandis]|uniref:uncharacterized protein LOC143916533 n=1 Tax=Arctopsyche grandis TaxID=121162 RepID=UPI00406D8063
MVIRVFLVLSAAAYAHALVNCDFTPKCYSGKIDVTGMPTSENEIKDYCKAIKEILQCTDNWAKECMTQEEIQGMREKIEEPFKFQKKLCDDEKFRSDYLQEKESIEKVSYEWKKCQTNFANAMTDATKNILEIVNRMCCAQESYKKCTSMMCESRCTPEADKIVQQILDMPKQATEYQCNTTNMAECPSKSSHTTYSIIASIITMSVLVLVR